MFLAGNTENIADLMKLSVNVTGSVEINQSRAVSYNCSRGTNQRARLMACGSKGLFASLLRLDGFLCPRCKLSRELQQNEEEGQTQKAEIREE